ncbi:hypothetical protein PCCS19_47780 [Paenibacillus sp. CCS19]|uniref:hypothetical protein n=1 Tax=Paenibacillus sp. CCS19 TaxID=3158387 RepID=UPI002564480B|nr:hypothetical protein [Paenibacillus cellulosilyticus]GMK41721.1 hypothetical protein PCCS19_47780 [Paenibacillus cellulosilyticus]
MIPTNKGQQTHLFQVEILVEGETNAKAMEQLLHVLNNGGFPDFRVLSGSALGLLIDAMREQHQNEQQRPITSTPAPQKQSRTVSSSEPAKAISNPGNASDRKSKPPSTPTLSTSPFASIAAQFREYMDKNKLIRLKVNKGLGVSLSIPGRIINLDEATELLTVYHVDEKQVYTFKLNEIDDFSV